MSDSPEFERFTRLYKLTERMIEDTSKESLADVARILALNVAHYQGKFGVLALEDSLALLNAASVNDDQAKMLADGFENLAAIIAIVEGNGGDENVVH